MCFNYILWGISHLYSLSKIKPTIFDFSEISDVSEKMNNGSIEPTEHLYQNTPRCFLCKSTLHLAYRCLMAKLIRDEQMPIPLNFCLIHCEKFTKSCKNHLCGIHETSKGKLVSLTCKHKDKHFLLCRKLPCYLISERYFQRYIKKS